MSQNSIIDIYLKQVEKCLFCPPKIRKDILSKIKNEAELAFETGGVNESNISVVFGSPDEIAKNYLLVTDAESLLTEYKKARKKKLFLTIICGILIFAIGLLLGIVLQDLGHSTSYVDIQQGFMY